MKISFYCLTYLFVSFLFAGYAVGQKSSENEFDKFIGKAIEKTVEYSHTFKNLTVEETKKIEIYDDGKLEKSKNIQSDLVIYESSDQSNLGEFRNVRSVNGKIIKDNKKRTVKLFVKLADAKAFEAELKSLNEESSRYDEGLSVYGLALWQAVPLSSGLFPAFKFEETGTEQIEGRKATIVNFRQIKNDLNLQFNIDTPKDLQVSDVFSRGKIWLDSENRQILRLIVEVAFDSPKLIESFVVMKQEFSYQPGPFGIYPPKKITIENFNPKVEKSLKLLMKTAKINPASELKNRLTLEYKNYSRFDVKVQAK